MQTPINRRDFVAAVGAGMAAGAWPLCARTQEAAPAILTLETLDDNVVRIAGAGANVTVVIAPDGLLLVDGGLPKRSPELRSLLAERWPGRPVRVLFNTNWREEHTGANALLHASGARVIAHENTKLWLGGDFFVDWEKRAYRPNPPDALPTETFYTAGTLSFGGESIAYGHLPRAHTDGDIYVFLPHANLLIVSDLLSVGRYPIVDYATGGWIGGLQMATQRLLDLADSTTRVLPADGPVQTHAALRAQLDMCTAVRERLAVAFRGGMSLADFAASEPTREFDSQWGDPAQFLALAYKGGWGHLRELGGVI